MVNNTAYKKIHNDGFLFDSHVDTVGAMLYRREGNRWAPPKGRRLQIDLPRLRQGNFGGLFFAAFVPPDDPQPTGRAMSILALTKKFAAEHPDDLALVTCGRELTAARRTGKIAVMHSLENGGYAIDGNLDLIDTFYALGVRCFGIVWNGSNALATGIGGKPTRSGLTRLGKQAIRLLNARGVILDISHINETGFRDVMSRIQAPVIASHSNVHALCPVPRNLKDDQIKAIATCGGVIGVNIYTGFLTQEKISTIAHVADHIEYIVALVGIDHVGIGTDFDGIDRLPEGLEHAGKMPALTRELVDRGFRKSDIRKILGQNHLRILREVIG